MKNKLFNEVLESNKNFWERENEQDSRREYLLYESFYSELPLIYGISKTALTIAKIKALQPICIVGLRGEKEKFSLINSMCKNIVGKFFDFGFSCLKNVLSIFINFLRIQNRNDLLKLKIEKYNIGYHIYDAVLRSLNLAEIREISFSVKKIVFLEICYFYFFKGLLEKYNVKVMVLGDNVYRCGLLFEIAKHNNIECVTPINLNGFSMRKYQNYDEFNLHDRKPKKIFLDNLDSKKIHSFIDEYFLKRFSANLEQHDVLNAFSMNKKKYSKKEIIEKYELKGKLPIVAVMSHIFCDAPHAYPDVLYDDYKEWLVQTVKSLKRNRNINFLIKEHPSADLYNEKGVINSILKELDCEKCLLSDDVHNLTVLDEFDVVVTCGGTIGQEFAYKGKPVVLAAKPPYSGFGFTVEPSSRDEYEKLLLNGIENLSMLNEKQKEDVYKVIYHDFILLNNYSDDLEIGGQRHYMGREIDCDNFYKQILNYNKILLDKQLIYKKLKKFIHSDNKHMFMDLDK